MSDLIAIAQNTFGRMVRIKALYVILGACVVNVWAMGLYGDLSVGQDQAMMFDAGLAFCLIVGMLTAMSGVFEVPRELREQTAQLILAKPLGRTQFLAGKFLGISMLCVYNVFIVGIGSAFVMSFSYNVVPASFWSGCLLIVGEAIILTSVGLLLSLFMRESLAAAVLFIVFAAGHAIHILPLVFSGGSGKFFSVVTYVLPALHRTDFKTLLGNGVVLPKSVMVPALAYALTYSVAVTAAAVAVFQRKDIG